MAVSALHVVTGADPIAQKEDGKNQGNEDKTEMEQEIRRYKAIGYKEIIRKKYWDE
jgi:hypothetical protein